MSAIDWPQWVKHLLRYPFVLLLFFVGFLLVIMSAFLVGRRPKLHKNGICLLFLGFVVFFWKEDAWT